MKILLAALSCLLFNIAHAQAVLTPIIGGVPVHCTDATGAPVFTVPANVSDAAMSMIIPQTGQRIIELNVARVSAMPRLLQLFVYAHECGHHLSGDIVAGLYGHDNPMREENADRIGIRLLRDQFHISLADAQAIAGTFYTNPQMPPYYLPGPMRAQWIVDCYQTDDDFCGHGSQFYHRPNDAPSQNQSMDDGNDTNPGARLPATLGHYPSMDNDDGNDSDPGDSLPATLGHYPN